jgi:chitin synthase
MYRIRSSNKNVPVLVSPGLIADYSENTVDTLHKKNLLHLGEDRYLTTLLLKHFPHMRTMFIGEARCYTVVPDRWAVLLSQRRRWINSTVHNLLELFLLDQLCGFCCFSMRFVVMLDLFATFVQPATILYIIYLIYAVTTSLEVFPVLSLVLLAAIYGFQVIIFILKREWQHIMWMVIYILAMPVISFYIPCYSFWHFDDFSWGNTRVVVDDGKKTVYVADTEPFDPKSIQMKRWRDYEDAEWDNESMSSASTFQSKSYTPTEASRPRSDYSMGAAYLRQSQVQSKKNHLSMVSFGEAAANPGLLDAQSNSSVPGPFGGNGVVTDELLYSEIQQSLIGADLMTLTKKQIRDNLSVKLGVDLRLKKEVMNRMIDEILAKQM